MSKPKGTARDSQGKGERALAIARQANETEDAATAKAILAPTTQAALTLRTWKPAGIEQDINAVITELQAQAGAANRNDLRRMEGMLAVQAHTLDAMFNHLAQRAHWNMGEYPEAAERYMRLALKAQSQCRATIETLADIKNPKPVAFVQQANIAADPQQVNNSQAGASYMRARAGAGNPNQENEVLEGRIDGNQLEQGTAGARITGDSSLATLGQGDRAEVSGGKG